MEQSVDQSKKVIRDLAKEVGKGFTAGAISSVGWLLIFTIILLLIGEKIWPRSIDGTDQSVEHRSGLSLRIDYGTGCEYLETSQGYLVPRLNAEGKHVCKGDRS